MNWLRVYPFFDTQRFLDNWAKEYGTNKVLGKSYLEAVVQMKFPVYTSRFPFMRAACIATNLVSPKRKIVDGTAKLLTKSDLSVLVKSDKRLQVTAAEHMMSEAWVSVHRALEALQITQAKKDSIFGCLATRTILFLTKKGKEGPESKDCTSLKEIKEKFHAELSGTLPAEAAPASGVNSSQANLSDVSDPVWIANRDGFAVGKYFSEKKSSKVYRVDDLTEEGVQLTEQTFETDTPESKLVDFDKLKPNFVPFKGKLQQAVIGFDKHMAHKMPAFDLDVQKACLFAALVASAQEHGPKEAESIRFLMYPSEVRAAKAVKKGELKLVPITDFAKLVNKSATSKHIITDGKLQLYLEQPNRARDPQLSEWRKDIVFAAFWWVKMVESKDEEDINMKLSKVTQDGITFPIFENTKGLKMHDKLVALDASPAKKART